MRCSLPFHVILAESQNPRSQILYFELAPTLFSQLMAERIRSRTFLVTMNLLTDQFIDNLQNLPTLYTAFAFETAPSTGHRHCHAYLRY